MNNAPHSTKPMMTIQESIVTCLRKYVVFQGRATRAEYWWWVLATFIGHVIFSLIDRAMSGFESETGIFQPLFGLAIFLPGLAVTCRRLHDINQTGWWQAVWVGLAILALIPLIIGVVITLVSLPLEALEFLGEGKWGNFQEDWFSFSRLIPGLIGLMVTIILWMAIAVWGIWWLVTQGQAGPNRFGPDPRALEQP